MQGENSNVQDTSRRKEGSTNIIGTQHHKTHRLSRVSTVSQLGLLVREISLFFNTSLER
jgi:hypothetical protein